MSYLLDDTDYCEQHQIRFVNRKYLLAFYLLAKESPIDTIDRWAGLIGEIEKGYNWEPGEFDSHLGLARTEVDDLLKHPALEPFSEHAIFRDTVSQLDECFRTLTFEHEREGQQETKWYNKRILKKAGPEYYSFFDENLRKSIQLVNV